ncbi:MAG: methyl-accepting chemotaxis protein [Pseudomonadota bacterium]|nr:methyl-accepting chemotaxis protein [Pseudomonadota bacterium]
MNLRMKFRSIWVIVLAGSVFAALGPVAVLGTGVTIEFKQILRNDSRVRVQDAATRLSLQFETFLDGRLNTLGLLASDLAQIDLDDRAAVTELMRRASQHFPGVSRLSFADADGVVRAAEPMPPVEESKVIGLSVRDRAYFGRAIESLQPIVDRNVILSRATNEPIIIFAAPVLDAAGRIRGVVLAIHDARFMRDTVQHFRVGSSGDAQIVGENGRVIAHTGIEDSAMLPNYSDKAFWKEMSARDSGVLENFYGQDSAARIAGFASVPASGWQVLISRSMNEVVAPADRAMVDLAIIVGMAVILAGIVATAKIRWIAAPIQALHEVATSIAGGKAGQRATESGANEIRALARAFNAMADSADQALAQQRETYEKLQSTVRDFGALAERIGAGDLKARTEIPGDATLARLGQGLNGMAASLESLVDEIREAASGVGSAAAQILAATRQQVAASTEEASAVRETSATVAEVRQTSEQAARKIRAVAEMATAMERSATEMLRAVESGRQLSADNKERMEVLAQRILQFSEQAQEIAEINSMVSGLAEQSNLLAVNASIEAAKAGEAGRGFNVVANEVRVLADRSREATSEVRRIVGEIQRSAQGAVMAVEQGVKSAETGVEQADRSSQVIALLNSNISETTQAARQISAAAEQQEVGMEQIALAMNDIELSSTQTVSATRQVESAAQDLNGVAHKLNDVVNLNRARGDRTGATDRES